MTSVATPTTTEQLARQPHPLPSGPINVTDERGTRIPFKRRSDTDLSSTSPPRSNTSLLRPHSLDTESFLRQPPTPSTSSHGGVALHSDPNPVATSSPFNKKSAPIVAKTNASSSGVSYFSPEGPKHLVMGDESLDFMKLSLRAPSSSPAHARQTDAQTAAMNAHSKQTGVEAAAMDASSDTATVAPAAFRPILLFIPLRLGQDTFNPSYSEALKVWEHRNVI